jgi:hypothetical protein
MDEARRRLLLSARDLIDAALEIDAPVALPGEQACPHPEDSRVDISTMGDPGAYYCRDCRAESHPNAVHELREAI